VSASCLLGGVVVLLSGGTLCAQGTYAPVEPTTWNPERPLVFPSAYVRSDLRRTYRRLFGEFESAVPIEYDDGWNVVCPPAQGLEVVPTPVEDAPVQRRLPSDAEPRSTPAGETPLSGPDTSWIPPTDQVSATADNSIRGADDSLPEWLVEGAGATDRRSPIESIAARRSQSVRTFDPAGGSGQRTMAESAAAGTGRRHERGLHAIVVPAVQFADESATAAEDDPIVRQIAAQPASVPDQPQFHVGMRRLGVSLLRVE